MGNFFLPYQVKWIKDNSRIKLMEKSRQIGMSWTTAYELVRRHCLQREKYDSWVSSRDELQAKLFIDDCKKFASILNAAVRETTGDALVGGCDSHSLGFANGTRIWSLSSNPDAQAGKRGARVLDEFALHPDPAKLYAIAYPGITWGGSLQIISTHRGSENFFQKLVEEARYGGNPKKISLHRVTLQDALEQGFLKKLNREGDTVVLITHDNSIAVKADRIVRLQDGKIIYDGDAHDPRAVVRTEEMEQDEPAAGGFSDASPAEQEAGA